MRCRWMWNTVWPASRLVLNTVRKPPADDAALASRSPRRAGPARRRSRSSPAVRSFSVAMWRFGTTSTCVGPLRVDVVEREHAIVFVDDRRRNLARDDLAEETVGHGPGQARCAIAVRAMPWRSRRTPTSVELGRALEELLDLDVLAEAEFEDRDSRRAAGAPGASATRRVTRSRPSLPPNSASAGSWSRTSGCSAGRARSTTYGGFATITSNGARRVEPLRADRRA